MSVMIGKDRHAAIAISAMDRAVAPDILGRVVAKVFREIITKVFRKNATGRSTSVVVTTKDSKAAPNIFGLATAKASTGAASCRGILALEGTRVSAKSDPNILANIILSVMARHCLVPATTNASKANVADLNTSASAIMKVSRAIIMDTPASVPAITEHSTACAVDRSVSGSASMTAFAGIITKDSAEIAWVRDILAPAAMKVSANANVNRSISVRPITENFAAANRNILAPARAEDFAARIVNQGISAPAAANVNPATLGRDDARDFRAVSVNQNVSADHTADFATEMSVTMNISSIAATLAGRETTMDPSMGGGVTKTAEK